MSADDSVETNAQQPENPFQANGELRRKADYIISHSRISKTEVQIVDPDSPRTPVAVNDNDDSIFCSTAAAADDTCEVPIEASKSVDAQCSSSLPPGTSASSNEGNGHADAAPGQQTVVEAEVKKAETVSDGHPQTAEQVKLKSKKKCCSVQ